MHEVNVTIIHVWILIVFYLPFSDTLCEMENRTAYVASMQCLLNIAIIVVSQ